MTLTILCQAKKKSLSKQQWVISVPKRLLSVAERRDDATLWKTGPCPNFFLERCCWRQISNKHIYQKKKENVLFVTFNI